MPSNRYLGENSHTSHRITRKNQLVFLSFKAFNVGFAMLAAFQTGIGKAFLPFPITLFCCYFKPEK